MKKFTIAAPVFGVLAATALGLAGAAAAAPTQGSSAADTVSSLQAQGYNVQLNGSATAPAVAVHGRRRPRRFARPGRLDKIRHRLRRRFLPVVEQLTFNLAMATV